jgi:hypothetical protein
LGWFALQCFYFMTVYKHLVETIVRTQNFDLSSELPYAI